MFAIYTSSSTITRRRDEKGIRRNQGIDDDMLGQCIVLGTAYSTAQTFSSQ